MARGKFNSSYVQPRSNLLGLTGLVKVVVVRVQVGSLVVEKRSREFRSGQRGLRDCRLRTNISSNWPGSTMGTEAAEDVRGTGVLCTTRSSFGV